MARDGPRAGGAPRLGRGLPRGGKGREGCWARLRGGADRRGAGQARGRARRDSVQFPTHIRAIFPAVCAACPRLWRANGAPRAPAALRDPTHGCWGPIAPLGAPRSGQFAEVCRHPSSDVG